MTAHVSGLPHRPPLWGAPASAAGTMMTSGMITNISITTIDEDSDDAEDDDDDDRPCRKPAVPLAKPGELGIMAAQPLRL
jgi:hypothetical protein